MRLTRSILSLFFLTAASITLGDVPSSVVIQGKLEDSVGAPLTGARNYRVRFFDAATVGFQIGSDITGTVTVPATGRFSISILPPPGILTATESWYELAIDSAATPNGVDSSDVFGTRVKVHSVPFALSAQSAVSAANSTSLGGVAASNYALKSDVSLQGAYDAGGAGAGRTINAASGAVTVNGSGGVVSLGKVDSVDSVRVTATAGGATSAHLTRTADGGKVETFDEAAKRTVNIGSATGGTGGVGAIRMTNETLVGVGLTGDPNQNNRGGQVTVFNQAQNFTSSMSVSAGGAGLIDTYFGGATNVPITTAGANSAGGGYFQIASSTGSPRVILAQLGSGDGALQVNDSTGAAAVLLAGDGTKAFVVKDPTRADRMIRYICLEGPEAAMYCRGKATVADGRVTIDFPSHFSALASPDSVTVTLTPRSSKSKGLAAENISAKGFDAVELLNGKGTYEVDWVAYAVRSGLEETPIYIDAAEWRAKFTTPLQDEGRKPATEVLSALDAAPASGADQ